MKVLKRSMALLLTFVIVMCATFVIVDAPTYAASRIKTPVIKGVYAVDDEYLEVNWTRRSAATVYKVYRSNTKNGKYQLIGATRKTRFNDDEVFIGKVYYYKVKALASKSKYNSKLSKAKRGEIPPFDNYQVTMYLEHPTVPDFGSFVGISEDYIERDGDVISYVYSYDNIEDANSRNDWAINAYGNLLQSVYGFKYTGQEYDEDVEMLSYSRSTGYKTVYIVVGDFYNDEMVAVTMLEQ